MQDPATLTIEALERDLSDLARVVSSTMQRWLDLVGEFDARGAARRWGFRGSAEWLAWHCSLSARAARDHVRVARRLRELPKVGRAFADGALSYSKVRALSRAGDSADEDRLLELASTCSAAQLENAVRSLRCAPSADLAVHNRNHEKRYLDWWWDPDGTLCVHGRLAADEGATLAEAIERGAEALHARPSVPAQSTEPGLEGPKEGWRPPLGARRVDALTEIVLSGAPPFSVVLHADLASLACTATDGRGRVGEICAVEDGPAIPSETARRLVCDAEAVSEGGRRRRVVSPALRLSLERRDRHCRFPGCTRRHGLHAHHIQHWAHGGATDRDNLVLLCRYHHRLVHEDGFGVRAVAGGLAFVRPDGLVIADAGTSPPGGRRPGSERLQAGTTHRARAPGVGVAA